MACWHWCSRATPRPGRSIAGTPAFAKPQRNFSLQAKELAPTTMNLRRLVNYVLFRDTTMKGEFRLMRKLAGPDCRRVFVDVGANDGFYGSNSFPFVAGCWR